MYLVMNSQGTHKLERETEASWGLMGMGVDGDLITSFDYFQNLARTSTKVPEKIQASTRKFRDRVLSDLKQGPAKSYKGAVVFTPRAVIDILLGALSYHLNGRVVVEKTGKWGLKNIGETILDPQLSILDNPWLTDRFGLRALRPRGHAHARDARGGRRRAARLFSRRVRRPRTRAALHRARGGRPLQRAHRGKRIA